MTDSEIHQALLAAVLRGTHADDRERATVLDEVNRHRPNSDGRVGCRPEPWRDCPVIVHYAHVYEVELGRIGAGVHARPV